MSKRKTIRLIDKAAALAAAALGIPYDHRKEMTAEQVLSLLHFDHDPIPHAHGGSDEHFNLTPLPIMAHRKKTAERDVPQVAKTKRIAKKEAIHQANMALKDGRLKAADEALSAIADPTRRRAKAKIPQRANPWPPKGSRPLRSRNSFERRVT